MVFGQKELEMEEKWVGGFKKDIGDYVFTRVTRATTLPGMGRGLVRSSSALLRGALHYIRVCRNLESGLSQDGGQ
jgi:hypothetical protein